jgi:ferritin-like metal-binding protein YciE
MENFMSQSEFHHLFVNELKGIYHQETRWISMTKELEGSATSEELVATLRTHNLLNIDAVAHLEKIFAMLGIGDLPQEYESRNDMIRESRGMIAMTEEGSMVRDAAIIICTQKVIHYAIATYGSLVTLARLMNHIEERELLREILDFKKQSDKELTALAENYVNLKAVQE